MTTQDIIRELGGIRGLAAKLGHTNHTTVQGWWDRGVIPARQQGVVLELAEREGKPIDPRDLIASAKAA